MKFDLYTEDKERLINFVENKIGKRPYIFSSISNEGVEELKNDLFKKCGTVDD